MRLYGNALLTQAILIAKIMIYLDKRLINRRSIGLKIIALKKENFFNVENFRMSQLNHARG
jgi:hypothetical protein